MSDHQTLEKGNAAGRDKAYLKSLLGDYEIHQSYPASKGNGAKMWPMNGEKASSKATTVAPKTHLKVDQGDKTPLQERTKP